MADAGERIADVANMIFLDAALAGEERSPIVGERVAVGARQPHAGNDDSVVVEGATDHVSGTGVGREGRRVRDARCRKSAVKATDRADAAKLVRLLLPCVFDKVRSGPPESAALL